MPSILDKTNQLIGAAIGRGWPIYQKVICKFNLRVVAWFSLLGKKGTKNKAYTFFHLAESVVQNRNINKLCFMFYCQIRY